MQRRTAQIPVAYELPHSSRRMTKLVIMTSRQFEIPGLGERDQFLRFGPVEGERLLNVYVAAFVQRPRGDAEMALRWRRNVNDIGLRFAHERSKVNEITRYTKPLGELPGHKLFAVADAHDHTSLDPLDLGRMRVSDLPASDDTDLKHGALFHDSSQNID
jgi:hypothetical protein